MAQITMDEQDIINSVCLYIADQHSIAPDTVEVELAYDDEDGFSAETFFNGREQMLDTFQLIQAIRLGIDEIFNLDPISAGINLELDETEGILALIN